jgi:hypothetical protein
MIKLQDVLLKAMAKKITWWEAAEIIGVTDRTMRPWRERLETDGYSGLVDPPNGARVLLLLSYLAPFKGALSWRFAKIASAVVCN